MIRDVKNPPEAALDIKAAQQELIEVADDFLEASPIDPADYDDEYYRGPKPPRSWNVLGTGLSRESEHGSYESYSTYDVIRTREIAKALGRSIGESRTVYTLGYVDYSPNTGNYTGHGGMSFETGQYEADAIDDYNHLTRIFDRVVASLHEADATTSISDTVWRKAKELMPDDEKPDGVRNEIWVKGQAECESALYFMLRPKSRSTRGARNIARQDMQPAIDQVDDIAFYNAMVWVQNQARREKQVRDRMARYSVNA